MAKNHDIVWLEDLYNQLYDSLYRLACFRLKEYANFADDANDIIQTAFLIAGMKDVRHHPNPKAWFYKTVDNLCHNAIRSHWRQRKRSVPLDPQEDSLSTLAKEESESGAVDLMLTLQQSLSAEDFELLKAYCIQEKSIDEISAETGYSPTRIRVRIHRIREKVKYLITTVLTLLLSWFIN